MKTVTIFRIDLDHGFERADGRASRLLVTALIGLFLPGVLGVGLVCVYKRSLAYRRTWLSRLRTVESKYGK